MVYDSLHVMSTHRQDHAPHLVSGTGHRDVSAAAAGSVPATNTLTVIRHQSCAMPWRRSQTKQAETNAAVAMLGIITRHRAAAQRVKRYPSAPQCGQGSGSVIAALHLLLSGIGTTRISKVQYCGTVAAQYIHCGMARSASESSAILSSITGSTLPQTIARLNQMGWTVSQSLQISRGISITAAVSADRHMVLYAKNGRVQSANFGKRSGRNNP